MLLLPLGVCLRGTAGSHDGCIFNFVRNLPTGFLNALPTYIPTSSVQDFCFLCTLARICYLDFLVTTILKCVRYPATVHLLVDLNCISVMLSDVEHFFIYLLAIFMSSLKKNGLLCPFLSGLHVFCY